MIIVTSAENLVHVMVNIPSASLSFDPITSDEAVNILEEARIADDLCYVWQDENYAVSPEINKVIEYKDLCAEEYAFDKLIVGDIVIVYGAQEVPHPWWIVVIDNVN